LPILYEIFGLRKVTVERANPYPEVTDLFCRLPLSTLST